MDSSDDENEQLPEFVENYYFCNDDGEPISFSKLPLAWTTNEITSSGKRTIDLYGTRDGGLQKFFQRVKAWKFEITGEEPEISVLSTDNYWIRVEKPRKSYQEIIRSVLITVNFLHIVKKDPEMSRKAVWSKLSQIFRLYEDRPSADDLQHHKGLIEEAVNRDESLKKSEYLVMILQNKPQKVDSDEDTSTKSKKDFIVEDDEEEDEDQDGADDEDEPFDSVCCICDNGGDLLCCDGVCMRSFHATLEAAEDAESACASLGLTREEVKEIPIFMCKNCHYKQHQCYACGQLGSSDKSLGAEVFQCVNATCGYFYHPRCVAKLLHRGNEVAAKELQDKILTGESFACPLHVCITCKQPEDKTISKLQMAVCRRCPTAYHRKCLPKKIAFEDDEDEDITQRAWTDLLVDRILIYCLKHEIDEDLGTPARNHIKFPGDRDNKKKSSPSVLAKDVPMSTKDFPSLKKKKPLAGVVSQTVSSVQSKKSNALVGKRTDIISSKPKSYNTVKKTSTEKKPVMTKKLATSATEPKVSLGNALYAVYTQSDLQKPTKPEKRDEDELTKTRKPVLKVSEPELDSDSKKRILDVMKDASSIITTDDIILKYEKSIPSRAYKNKMDMKSITQGKVEGFCQAVRVASKKLDETENIEDAKSILNPNGLSQLVKWKNKLSVYLSPFLYGMRYTSYGRHFTKIDKLKEIVDKIHWYVNNGDTIVDFCCGANDFSLLMKQKLDQFGKNCSFKNFDLFRPKNDFCFEKRDWLEAKPGNLQLPTGSQLIMGLNPPFGVKAALANKFIDKALEFKPKLLILIVPPETERLDTKKTPYDLIWEDYDKLSGKSFYLPGSVDVNDQQLEDWNNVPPVLYLWSRTDWTEKHKSIAEKHGHLSSKTALAQHSPVISKDPENDAVEFGGPPEDVLADSLTEKVAGGAADTTPTLGKRSAHNEDDEGEKLQSSVGGQKNKKRKQQQKKQRSIDSEAKLKRSSPSKAHESGPRHSPDPIVERRKSQERFSMDRRTPSDMEVDDASRDPVVERPIHPTNYDATSYGRASSLDAPPREVDYYREPPQPNSSSDVGVYGITRDGYHGGYPERVGPYPAPDPYSGRRERWAHVDDASTRSGGAGMGYNREVDYGYHPPPLSNAEPRFRPPSYSMGPPTYSRMNTMPVSERYALRLDDPNPPRMGERNAHMPGDVGGGVFNYGGPRPRQAHDHMGFAPGPVNYYPPHGGPRGGWLHE